MTKQRWNHEFESPIGRLRLVADDEGLRRIDFLGGPRGEWLRDGQEPLDAHSRAADVQLRAYFAGELRAFNLSLAPEGTEFQRRTWQALTTIPYGETTTYGDIARRIGSPKGSRAVGLANGANPLPIVIPCHRVIGSNGSLTGYGGGLPIKQALLELERGIVGR